MQIKNHDVDNCVCWPARMLSVLQACWFMCSEGSHVRKIAKWNRTDIGKWSELSFLKISLPLALLFVVIVYCVLF